MNVVWWKESGVGVESQEKSEVRHAASISLVSKST